MKVALFGAGTMGRGIAQVFAAKGHTVLMYASSPASAQRHKDTLGKSLAKRVEKGKMAQEAMDALMANVLIPQTHEEAADADLVIECVKEEMATKKELLNELDGFCKPETVFASNTSSVHHRDGQRPEAPRHRNALLQPRALHEAGGDHPRRQHHPGDL